MDFYDPTRIPLGPSPDGHGPRFEDGPSQSWIPRLSIYTTLPLAVALMVLRLSTRFRLGHGLWWDDYLCMGGMAASGCFCGIMLAQQLDDGNGRHYWDTPLSAITRELMEGTSAITACYCWAAALTKLSLCALYLRLFSPLRPVKIMIWAGIIFICISYATLFAVWVAYSVPRPGGSWTDPAFFVVVLEASPTISVALSSVSIASDFYVLAIPLFTISNLNLTRKRKMGVSALFATGLLACAFCVAGLPLRLDNYRATNVHNSPDPFWTSMPAYGLAVAEINLGIFCACMPVSAPLFRGWKAKVTSTSSSWKWYLNRYRGSSVPSDTSSTHAVTSGRPSAPSNSRPKALSSFLSRKSDNSHRSKAKQGITVTQAVNIEMAPYSELRSIDADYHSYLRPGQVRAEEPRPGSSFGK